jgi:hypothetical protein
MCDVGFSCYARAPSGVGYSNNCALSVNATCTQTCTAGYSDNNNGMGQAYSCTAGGFAGTFLTCSATPCAATQVPSSNYAGLGSVRGSTGQSRSITCNAGFSGSGSTTCGTNGVFTTVVCVANACTATQVLNSDHSAQGSVSGTTGQSVLVTCNSGYAGGGVATCSTTGTFSPLACRRFGSSCSDIKSRYPDSRSGDYYLTHSSVDFSGISVRLCNVALCLSILCSSHSRAMARLGWLASLTGYDPSAATGQGNHHERHLLGLCQPRGDLLFQFALDCQNLFTT